VVGVYERDDDLVAAIAHFLADALEQHGTAVVVATPQHRAAVDAALTRAGIPVAELARTGAYVTLDADDALASFMAGDRPDPDRFGVMIETIFTNAAPRVGPVCFFGEMVALLWERGNLEGALALESLWNDMAERHTFALFCAYAMSALEASGDLAAAKRMCDRHSSVVPLSEQPEYDARVAAPAGIESYDRFFVAMPTAARDVRCFVRNALTPWADETSIENAEIIASELATNAVRHAQSPFRVGLVCADDSLRISVRDASFALPVRLTPDGVLVGGRGVQLVAALAREWGTRDEPDGKTVWAELTILRTE
jgi:anti-sigma regulatory factor (Ser/Thr protein kinase)